MFQAVDTDPTALASIDTGTRYAVVNRGAFEVRLKVSAIAPGQSGGPELEDYIPIPRRSVTEASFLYPQADDGESIWVWTATDTSTVAYEPATG